MMGRSLLAVAPLLLLLAACSTEDSATPAPASPTSIAVAPSVAFTTTPTATPRPTPSPTQTATAVPLPTVAPTHTPRPEPTPIFSPVPVIIPTAPVPIPTPTIVPDNPLARTLDGIGLRVNLIRELSSKRAVEREFIPRKQLGEQLLELLEEDREELRKTQRLYATLGILEKGTDLFDVIFALYGEGVLGYYLAEEEKFYVVQDAPEFGPVEERTYVHEFVHALQQQHFDIQSTFDGLEDNSDASAAFGALVESDAVIAELVYMFDHMTEEEQAASQGEPSSALIQAFRSAPHVIQRAYLFRFQEGFQFVATLFQNNEFDAINQAFEEIPQSTEQILHPDKYVSRDEPDTVELPELVEVLGEGWTEVDRDTMGEFFLLSYLETDFAAERAAAAADGWGGDTYRLFRGPQDESLLVLAVTWDSENDAQEFFDIFAEFTEARTGAQWETLEDGVTVSQMTLPEQVIFISSDMLKTELIFAPGPSILETVRAALR